MLLIPQLRLLQPWELADSVLKTRNLYSVGKIPDVETKTRNCASDQCALRLPSHHSQVHGQWLLTLEPTGPSLLVLRDLINKAEERGCHSVAVTKKTPLKPVEEKQLVLPRTKISSGGS